MKCANVWFKTHIADVSHWGVIPWLHAEISMGTTWISRCSQCSSHAAMHPLLRQETPCTQSGRKRSRSTIRAKWRESYSI